MSTSTTRRDLFKLTTAGAALALAHCARAAAPPVEALSAQVGGAHARTGSIPLRRFGSTKALVSAIGIGGSHLAEAPDEGEATRIVHEALDAGVTFFDNAWEYHDGKSEEILGRALAGKRNAAFLMTKVCTHGRDRAVAMQQLEDSLRRLRTDHLDLWQIHECIYKTTIPRCTSRRTASSRRSSRRSSRGRCASSVLRVTRTPTSTWRCSRA